MKIFAHVCFPKRFLSVQRDVDTFCKLQVWVLDMQSCTSRSYGPASESSSGGDRHQPNHPFCGWFFKLLCVFVFLESMCVNVVMSVCMFVRFCLYCSLCVLCSVTTTEFLVIICICAGPTKARDVGESILNSQNPRKWKK